MRMIVVSGLCKSCETMVREFLNRDEDEQRIREAKRIEALESWYAIFDKYAQNESEPVKPLTREEICFSR